MKSLCLNCLRQTLKDGRCTACGKTEGFAQQPVFALPAGTVLEGRYLTGGVLGFGGFGITYLGLDLTEGRRIAIKEFMPASVSGRTPGYAKVSVKDKDNFEYGLKRFCDEARTIYKYRQHPNIVHVYKLFKENGTAYYVMEYLEGMDLKAVLKKNGGKMDFSSLMKVMLPIMEALECVHADHVIHRDISPDNIFVGNTVKLIDFGAAREAFAGQSKSLSIILKRGFAPEEQYRSHGVQGPWTDIYALAGTMYYALTGTMVPEAPERLVHDEIEDIAQTGAVLPQFSAAAIMKALSVKAESRYQNVADFKAALLYPAGENMSVTGCPVELRGFKMYGLDGFYAGASLTVEDSIVIGRDASACQLVYPRDSRGISKRHCRLSFDAAKMLVIAEDLYSTFGTCVNGRMLVRGSEAALNSGDIISFGENQIFKIVI